MKMPLEPWQIKQLLDDRRRGLTVDALAARYGISRRSVQRYQKANVERIYLYGWTAWFALYGEDREPQRLTEWEVA